MPDRTHWRILGNVMGQFIIDNNFSKEYQVVFTFGEDSQIGLNNFNWTEEVSSVQLIKLPQKNFKSVTESGEKFNLKKFTQVSSYNVQLYGQAQI